MLSLQVRLGRNRRGPSRSPLWQILTSKLVRTVLSGLLAFSFVFTVSKYLIRPKLEASRIVGGEVTPSQDDAVVPSKGRLHLLAPVTSINSSSCRLLLSAQILDYPTPIFINYGDAKVGEDGFEQELAKVEGILKYLNQLETSGDDGENLVLIIDGFDTWFQLRPDVLLKRYYGINEHANARIRETYGDALIRDDVRQTIIFGSDKTCSSGDWSGPACWAVPEAALAEYAFGPQTYDGARETNMPRWLNLGMVMGPAGDMKRLFNAALDLAKSRPTTMSNQSYLAEIFGLQEYVRLSRRPDLLGDVKKARFGSEIEDPAGGIVRAVPDLSDIAQTEHHMGIDYSSSAFQTFAHWKPYLTFMRPVDSWMPPTHARSDTHALRLPRDISQSKIPFVALESTTGGKDGLSKPPSWMDVELVFNVVTRTVPVLVQFTGEEQSRDFWWEKTWFQSSAAELRQATLKPNYESISRDLIGGRTWFNVEPEETDDMPSAGRGALGSTMAIGSAGTKCANLTKSVFIVFLVRNGSTFRVGITIRKYRRDGAYVYEY